MEWVYLTTAPDQIIGETWAELLRAAGIDVTLSPEDVVSFLGVSAQPCRLLVRANDLARGREALLSHGLEVPS